MSLEIICLDKYVQTIKTLYKFFLKYPAANGPETEQDLGVVDIGFDYDSYLKSLSKTCKESKFDIDQVEEINFKDKTYPIHSIDINKGAKRKLMVIAGVHGNEQAGMLAIPKILEEIANNKVKYKDFHIQIIPIANPVGAAYFSRYNGQGIDINRDFMRYETKEAKLLKDITLEFNPELVLNFHEGPQENTFLWAFTAGCFGKDRLIELADRLESKGVKLAKKTYFGTRLKVPGIAIVNGSVWGFLQKIMHIRRMYTYGEMALDHGIPSITSESSWRTRNAKQRVNSHLNLFVSFVTI